MNPTSKTGAKDILDQIHERAQTVWKSKDDPETLSRVLVELAGLNWGLGQWLADAEEAERDLKTEYEYHRAKFMNEQTETAGSVAKAEILATLDDNLKEEKKEYNVVKHGLELYKLRRRDTDKLMDAIRSRLSLIKQDIRNEP